MKTVLIGLMIAALTGCASSEFKQAQADHYKAQAEIQKSHAAQEATPLLSLTMGEDGKLKSLIVGRQQSALQYVHKLHIYRRLQRLIQSQQLWYQPLLLRHSLRPPTKFRGQIQRFADL